MSAIELRANRAYNTDAVPGHYVVNPATQIAVAGPYASELEAPPSAPDSLEVVEIVMSS